MPNTCCGIGCKTGYKSRKKKKDEPEGQENDDQEEQTNEPPKLTLFSFPKHDKDPELRARWIARVPRHDSRWLEITANVNAKLYLCEKHFLPGDIITDSTDTNTRRKRKSEELNKKRVKPGGLPSLWPDAPAHLSKVTVPRPTSLATSCARSENAERIQQEIDDERTALNTFNSLEELVAKETMLNLPANILKPSMLETSE